MFQWLGRPTVSSSEMSLACVARVHQMQAQDTVSSDLPSVCATFKAPRVSCVFLSNLMSFSALLKTSPVILC